MMFSWTKSTCPDDGFVTPDLRPRSRRPFPMPLRRAQAVHMAVRAFFIRVDARRAMGTFDLRA